MNDDTFDGIEMPPTPQVASGAVGGDAIPVRQSTSKSQRKDVFSFNSGAQAASDSPTAMDTKSFTHNTKIAIRLQPQKLGRKRHQGSRSHSVPTEATQDAPQIATNPPDFEVIQLPAPSLDDFDDNTSVRDPFNR